MANFRMCDCHGIIVVHNQDFGVKESHALFPDRPFICTAYGVQGAAMYLSTHQTHFPRPEAPAYGAGQDGKARAVGGA